MYLLKQGGYELSPRKDILFLKNNVTSKFYESKREKFSKFSHSWQVLAGLVEPLLDRPSTCAIAQPQKLAH
jgi:hypothetical protein